MKAVVFYGVGDIRVTEEPDVNGESLFVNRPRKSIFSNTMNV
jgi:hypothetical protein